MKKSNLFFAMFVFCMVALTNLKAETNSYFGVNQYFFDFLRPHGTWMQLDDGMVVFRPRIISMNWRPYSEGRWFWTNQGWYWDSNESFAEVVYHYGRWYNDYDYGWVWIPDNVWAPAWVDWRCNDDYIAWVPLSPYATFGYGFGMRYSRVYEYGYHHWNFVHVKNFHRSNIRSFYVEDNLKERIFGSTTTRTSYTSRGEDVINHGMDRDFIERRTGERVVERNISYSDTRNGNSTISRTAEDKVAVYKPTREVMDRTTSRDVVIEKTGRNLGMTREDNSRVKENNTTTRENQGNVKREDNIPVKKDDSRTIDVREKTGKTETTRTDVVTPKVERSTTTNTRTNENTKREDTKSNNTKTNVRENDKSTNTPSRNTEKSTDSRKTNTR